MIALTLGGAHSVWDELRQAKRMIDAIEPPVGRIIVAANYAGILYPGYLNGWATVHHERFDRWRSLRREAGRNGCYQAFIYEAPAEPSDADIVTPWARGSSGLFAAQCAIERMGAKGVILCGMPMDDTGSHIHWGGDWSHRHFYVAAFEQAATEGRPIRSMSGWSRHLFGAPDAGWVAQCR